MKLRIEFGFGIGYRGNGDAILFHEQLDGLKEICDRAVSLFDGYTKYNTVVAWRDPDTNIVVTEEGCTVSVLVDDDLANCRIAAMVQQIKASLQQKAVAVTRTEVKFDIL